MGGIMSEIYFFPYNVTLILLYKIKSEGEIDNWYYVLNFPLSWFEEDHYKLLLRG